LKNSNFQSVRSTVFCLPTRQININGTAVWSVSGYYHREDGPAIIYADGRQEFWRNGRYIDPNFAVGNKYYSRKYPKLVESMLIYLVHNL
jgi:hypothetical protein